ncbi:MAG: YdeI/OmpD-associated family protein [Bacteroidia bacterium]
MANPPLIDADYLLQKFPGKGGWTYAEIPEIKPDWKRPFGWVRVRGFIDDYEIKQYNLMPMGNGMLFMAVKAAIRKKIGKEAGDSVRIVLFLDQSEVEIPEELVACFELEPKKRYDAFMAFSESERKAYIDWIYDAKTEDTKARRIIAMMERLKQGLRLHDR